MLCYKRQGNYAVSNELPSGAVGWVVARGTVCFGNFEVRIQKFPSFFFPFPFCKFLSLVSFLGLGLVLDLVLVLVLGLSLGLGFKPDRS